VTDDGTSYGSARMEWAVGALCAQTDPHLWHPDKHEPTSKQAKWICGRCESLAACDAYALADRSLEGVWGGRTQRERTAIRRKGGQSDA
jgi:WhiB family redox-sensing transcriptional regulator